MKVSLPLSLKVSLWLLANLLLLAAAGGTLYVGQFGVGWNSLTRGALGERLQGIGDSVSSDLHADPDDLRGAILAARAAKYGADFFLFSNSGTLIAGGAVNLPAAVHRELVQGNRRSAPGPDALGPRPPRARPPRGDGTPNRPPPLEEQLPPENDRPPGIRPANGGRFVVRTAEPDAIWIGLREPIPNEFGAPTPGVVLIRATSILAVGRLLYAGPWLAIAAGAFLLSVLFWLPLVGSITHAIRRLTSATERIAEGQFETRVHLSRRDELGRLGGAVDQMAERLDTLVNGQKRFLGDVAHELGSPLGRLQVAIEILETRANPALREHVEDVREEIQQMSELVNELLAFTKSDLRPRDAALADLELKPLLAEMLRREAATARVALVAPDGLAVRADAPLLSRAVANLIRNAVRYAGAAGTITVTAGRDGDTVVVAVEDEGPGVPPEALGRLGEPFYRPEAARARETGGVGLGLAIVRSSVKACGGVVHFANRSPRGFRAEIRLVASYSNLE